MLCGEQMRKAYELYKCGCHRKWGEKIRNIDILIEIEKEQTILTAMKRKKNWIENSL